MMLKRIKIGFPLGKQAQGTHKKIINKLFKFNTAKTGP